MAFIKTLIVDDEQLARNRVRRFLSKFNDFEIVAEAVNGRDALAKISQFKPDLIFLDIQMPDLSGFDVLKRITQSPFPLIVFVTAYSKFALTAFDFYALDYLVKPFDQNRFEKCIQQVLLRVKQQEQAQLNQQIIAMLKARDDSEEKLTELKIKDKSIWKTVPVNEIMYMESYGNYLKVNLNQQQYLYRSTMNEMADQLDAKRFVRIQRSLLVNRSFIEKISYLRNNEFQISLKTGQQFKSGRYYRPVIEAILH